MRNLLIFIFGRSREGILKIAYNTLEFERDGIRVDSIGRASNRDGMARGSGIVREELWDLINLHAIDTTLHGT
jgi:hypothetical protein